MATEGIERSVLAQVGEIARAIVSEVSRAYIGDPRTTEYLLTALLARGHVLLEGVPGVAKTTLVKAFSRTLGCKFSRVQFTPDLLPSDITGTYILDMRTSQFVLRAGPIFANVLLGDEINRAPAKTQSALLEAMQEHQVTIEGDHQDAAGAVHRAGHAKPHRARGHLPAARGPGRPLPDQAAHDLPGRCR